MVSLSNWKDTGCPLVKFSCLLRSCRKCKSEYGKVGAQTIDILTDDGFVAWLGTQKWPTDHNPFVNDITGNCWVSAMYTSYGIVTRGIKLYK